MKIKWLGHSSFLIIARDGIRIITDPFGDYPGLKYNPIKEKADIVVVSHSHGDHVGGTISGYPRYISDAGEQKIGAILFRGIKTFHDKSKGKDRGQNTIFCINADGINICHLGDLGHGLSDAEIAEIGQVDILMIPVGGFYTIDSNQANEICNKIKPRIILPMHYKSDKCKFPIAAVDDFLTGKSNIKKADKSEIEIKKESLPKETQIIVLKI